MRRSGVQTFQRFARAKAEFTRDLYAGRALDVGTTSSVGRKLVAMKALRTTFQMILGTYGAEVATTIDRTRLEVRRLGHPIVGPARVDSPRGVR